jgi:hypothetical protein
VVARLPWVALKVAICGLNSPKYCDLLGDSWTLLLEIGPSRPQIPVVRE